MVTDVGHEGEYNKHIKNGVCSYGRLKDETKEGA